MLHLRRLEMLLLALLIAAVHGLPRPGADLLAFDNAGKDDAASALQAAKDPIESYKRGVGEPTQVYMVNVSMLELEAKAPDRHQVLVKFVVCVISGPIALVLEPQTAHICALNFLHGFKSRLAVLLLGKTSMTLV